MPGIGFAIRRLGKSDDLFSKLKAYCHGMMATSGPWLITVIGLALFFHLTDDIGSVEENLKARLLILYNFGFSVVMTAPVVIITNRYLANCVFTKDLGEVFGLLLGSMATVYLISSPLLIYFYFFYANLTFIEALLSCYLFMIISSIWLFNAFITALKNYSTITYSYLFGMIICVLVSVQFTGYGAVGVLLGFSIGLSFLFASLFSLILVQYPKKGYGFLAFLPYYKEYWEIALGGLLFNASLWVDKWIIWSTPEATLLPCGLIMYPEYDTAMILAYLSVIPSLAMFLVSQETYFFELYYRYYEDIRNHASFRKIQFNHERLRYCVGIIGRNQFVFQFSVCFILILLAPKIIVALNMKVGQLAIFRYGVLGSTFQICTLYLIILLSYLDDRKGVFRIQLCAFLSNILFTTISVQLGFPYYGSGYYIAALLTFCYAAVVTERQLNDLPYNTFVAQNI